MTVVKNKRRKLKVINPMSVDSDWSWKPEIKDIPRPIFRDGPKKKKKKNKARRNKTSKKLDQDFYSSDAWLELRVRVLEHYECKCMMCGESPKEHGIVIHVDHIKPRSKYPKLSLDFNNLQLMCAACNLGKGNKYETDWRPEDNKASDTLDSLHLASISHLL